MKAFVLLSGGLDSVLAAQLVKEQGIQVTAVYFAIPFCSRAQLSSYGCPDALRRSAQDLGVELKVISIADDFLKIVENPRHGFGSHVNPCIDCKILMLRKCKEMMEQGKASFVATGEVLGQRPMSQHKGALARIEQDSGLEGLVLRPLCAKLLPPTIPEKEGWISREKLLAFNGRSRRPQMELAKKFNLSEYKTPAGGCLLTDPMFARKVKDLLRQKEFNLHNVELLKCGRHFRVSTHARLVVGRDEKEDERLLGLALQGDYIFLPTDTVAGATALGRGVFDEKSLGLACKILGRYFDLNGKLAAQIVYRRFPEQDEKTATVEVFSDSQIAEYRI